MNNKLKIAVIGAGLGGLSAAVRLANAGHLVDVYEKNSIAGGKAGILNLKGFRFDTGPSLLTMPFIISQLFDECSENIEEFLDIKQLEVICKYFFDDGTVINAFSDIEKFGNEISNNTSDKAENLKNYLNYSKKIYELTAEIFLFNSPTEIKNYFSPQGLKSILNFSKIDTMRTMHEANSVFFSDKKMIQFFDRYATYNGSNPYKAPATLNIIPHVEYNLGSYYLQDGIYSLTSALQKLALKKGVNFFFNSPIEKILHKNKVVYGIKVNNTKKNYDVVLSNSDVNFTYKYLLDDNSAQSKKYDKLEPSLSGIVFYWGVKGNHENMNIHNILFSKNYEEEFIDIFEKKIAPKDPTIYIYISSKFKKSDAPIGFENWFVMINAPYSNGQNWEKEICLTKERIIKSIKEKLKIDLKEKIICEKILSPVELENRTLSRYGSIYGISSNNKKAAFLRPPNKSKHYKKLYFCGGSVHPGGGIPLVILSGKIAFSLIMKYEND